MKNKLRNGLKQVLCVTAVQGIGSAEQYCENRRKLEWRLRGSTRARRLLVRLLARLRHSHLLIFHLEGDIGVY